jgi:site-specific DNA-methyltransferase (adenine-specific)
VAAWEVAVSAPVPFFESGAQRIFRGDCRELLPRLSPASYDMVLADPPYGDTSLDWDVRDLRWLELVTPLVKPTGSVWCWGSMEMFMEQAAGIRGLGWRRAQEIVWEKHNGSGFVDDRFKRVHDFCLQFYRIDGRWEDVYKSPVTTPDAVARVVRRKKRPPHMGDVGAGHYVSEDGGPRLMRSVIYARSCHGYADHPTQKPVEVLRPLIEYSCPPGGRILDPTTGACSTLVAARQIGRASDGIELLEKYCASGARRLTSELDFGRGAA